MTEGVARAATSDKLGVLARTTTPGSRRLVAGEDALDDPAAQFPHATIRHAGTVFSTVRLLARRHEPTRSTQNGGGARVDEQAAFRGRLAFRSTVVC